LRERERERERGRERVCGFAVTIASQRYLTRSPRGLDSEEKQCLRDAGADGRFRYARKRANDRGLKKRGSARKERECKRETESSYTSLVSPAIILFN